MPKQTKTNKAHMQRFAENAHIKETRRLRAELFDLQMKYQCLESDHKCLKSEHKMAKNDAKRAKPFLDKHKGKGGK